MIKGQEVNGSMMGKEADREARLFFSDYKESVSFFTSCS